MSANVQPVFPLTPNISWGVLATGNTDLTAASGTVVTLFTAGANGSRLDLVKAMNLGTNVASVLRIFVNNGSATSTAANNSLLRELSLPANTVSQVAQSSDTLILDMGGFVLKSGYKLIATVGTTGAAGWQATVQGGDY